MSAQVLQADVRDGRSGSETAPLLLMKGISKRYGGVHALRRVDFSAHAGEVHALVGENGAGKSTLMKILSGAVMRDSGEIWLEGEKIELQGPASAGRLGIRVVYQEMSLVPNVTVGENLLLGRWPERPHGLVDWKDLYAQAERQLASIGFSLDVRRSVTSLRVAEKQMLEIAKAVAVRPRILILDEPTAVLEEEETRELFSVIESLKASGTTVIYISHRLDEVFTVADRVTVLKDGEVVATRNVAETSKDELIRLMVGRAVNEVFPRRVSRRGRPVLEVRGLSSAGLIKDVALTLHEGEVVGLAGLVGSGRTELARCIFGAERPTAGRILLDGREIALRSPQDAIARGIALLTEDRKKDGLMLDMNVGRNISIASLRRLNRLGLVKEKEESSAVGEVMSKLSVRPPDPTRLVRHLSGGNQQKVALAKWLMTDSRVIMLDQPTWGVDIGTMVEIYGFIAELAEQGKAILLISSVLPEILGMSDRILVMREGRIVAELGRDEATEERILSHAMGAGQ